MKFIFNNHPKNIYEVFQPVYYIFKIFGLFSFSFNGSLKSGNLQFKNFDKLWILILILVQFVFIFFNFMDMHLKVWKSEILNFSFRSILIIGITGNMLLQLYQTVKRKSVKEFLRGMELFDKEVKLKLKFHLF